jgi:hypothetical protein
MTDRPRIFDDLAGVAGGAISALAGLREEAEAIWMNGDSETTNPLANFDPRAAVIDPTKTPEEGSVIWSPSSSETGG